jgi:hypothetical protein
MINKRIQMANQKTEFNNSLICQFPNIFKCSKCKHNNSINNLTNHIYQLCLFCGNPNYLIGKRKN